MSILDDAFHSPSQSGPEKRGRKGREGGEKGEKVGRERG